MLDFAIITSKLTRSGIDVYPKFRVGKSSDLMIRGRDFYAIWIEEEGRWSTDEQDAINLIDKEIDIYIKSHHETLGEHPRIRYMWDAESGVIDDWHKYCQRQMRDNYHSLDEKLIFSNDPTNKLDYASKRLPYPLLEGDISAYEQLISELYNPDERHKIEWAIGAIVSGDSKKIQKFLVLYGSAGTGKSTILNIIQDLFEGYYTIFDAKALGSSNNAFALEAFKNNPLVAIQHDGDLSHIEDNTRLNSLVSHESMTVNEKFKSIYSTAFKCFLFMGTNKPVRITDAKSGLIRRLIDVSPTGNKIPISEYRKLTKQIKFELGAIAKHCLDVYQADPGYYDDYIPLSMIGASNDFYNYILDSYNIFSTDNYTTLKIAWDMYRNYVEYANVPYSLSQRAFKEELKNYFADYKERYTFPDGTRVRSYYEGFLSHKFEDEARDIEPIVTDSFIFKESIASSLDEYCANCPAQYASKDEIPLKAWNKCATTLKELDPTKLHYILPPDNLIVIDFDIPDSKGNKSLEKNLEAASQWPKTYAELSKSGQGIHLHYIYDGDVTELSRIFDEHIEVKVFLGKSSLRRKLTKCNDIPIAHISSGLPKQERRKANVINEKALANEQALRTFILKNLKKKYHSATKPSMDFIYHELEKAYNSGMVYDVSDLYNDILVFAACSTHNADYCLKLLSKMHLKSESGELTPAECDDSPLIFYDVEVFPNLFVICYKVDDEEHNDKSLVTKLINPRPIDIEKLIRCKLVGFNCRRYDNHILMAAKMGYSNEDLYYLSQSIINDSKGYIGSAYNISYTDIYDFASAGNKKSLKKLEIEMGIHHHELGLPWDKPVPEELWNTVADYCADDVLATEKAFHYLSADWTTRQILAELTGLTPNDTTNTLSTKFIFGDDKHPQNEFNYRFMGDLSDICHPGTLGDPEYTLFNSKNKCIFPGYSFEYGKSIYRGEEVGEGGYVYAEPGIHYNVTLLDIASMHPSSIIAEVLFGERYTKRFAEVLQLRLLIKHKQFDEACKLFDGAVAKYLEDKDQAKVLSNAFKTVINSVYGLTSAKFDNAFRDIRNIDNIVAKRGALFMVNLKHEVQNLGFTVAHIKTDSIKIPNATPEIINFVMEYGKQYGYTFEHEATYEKMCLVNDSVYIARYSRDEVNGEHAKEWTATGKQFAVPYVFKRLFTHEPIIFDDVTEVFSTKTAIYLKQNENYRFIGKVGEFCPVKSEEDGGYLVRDNGVDTDGNIKYAALAGTLGYFWMDSESIRPLPNRMDIVDLAYYETLASKAIETIEQYGNFDTFVS